MDTVDPLRFIASFIFILSLIGLMAFILKRYTHRVYGFKSPVTGKEQGRIEIIETRYLDPKRRLILIRRDDREHLLLLSDGRELVIESDIKRTTVRSEGLKSFDIVDTGT